MTVGGGKMNKLLMENPMSNMIRMVCIVAVVFFVASCEGKAQGVSDNTTEPESAPIIREELQQAEPEQEKILVENLEGTPLDIDLMSDDEKKIYLTGIWMLFFPTPEPNWGYQFRENGSLLYVDNSEEALKQRYRFTDGEWRIVGNEIQVKMLAYRVADRDPVEDIIGLNFPEDTQYITVPVEDDTWHTIGTLESVRTRIVRNGLEFPPRITLHPLIFDRVLDEEEYYYRDRP